MATKVGKRRVGAPKAGDSVPPAILADPTAPEPVAHDLATLIANVPPHEAVAEAAVDTTGSVAQAGEQVATDAEAVADDTVEASADVVEHFATVANEVPASVSADVSENMTEAAEAVTPPAVEAAADTVQKEIHTMATAFQTTTPEAPKLFNDVNDRAKAAFEKGGKFVQEMGEFGKGNVEALVESSRIAAKGFEALGQDAADYSRRSFEGLTATMKNLASVKSPTDFFKLQSDYVRGAFDAAVAEASKNTEAMIKLAGDAAQPISSRVALAVDKVKTAA